MNMKHSWNDANRRKTGVLGEKLLSVPLRPP